jgi:hypothetical protein
MEEIHVWNTVRSAAQIQTDMNQLAGDEPGLVLYYPLDEGSGSTAFDRTANHYDGTLSSTVAGDQPAWLADPGPGPGRSVATFTSGDPSATASDFTATIAWGDGHTSAGTVTPDGRGGFNVSGSNTYAAPGTYTLTVAVTDAFGGTGMDQSTVQVVATSPLFLVNSFPSPILTGTPGDFTVTALDAQGNVLTNYSGTVHFTSSDPRAQLPNDYTFTDNDNGVHTFTATLNTVGVQLMTASDLTSGITGTQRDIQVIPPPPVITGTTITATAGKTFGVAVGFDGADDYIQAPSTLVLGGAVTVEAWVKSANVFAPWARVIDFANGPNLDNIVLGWMGNSGRLYWESIRNGQVSIVAAPTVFPQNQWVHVAAVNDGNGTGFLYINGVLVASGPHLTPATVTRTQQWIARSNYAADAFFGGSMEEIHVWNTVRSAAQIQTDMNQLAGDEPGLVLYYPLDEGSGSTAFDRTANHYDGTLTSIGAGDQPAWVADPGPGPGRVVATFTNDDPSATASDFTATIAWGDGHTSAGTVTPDGRGGFNVSGSNTYAAPGTYTLTVAITDRFGNMAAAQSTAVVVGPGPAVAPGVGGAGAAWPAFALVSPSTLAPPGQVVTSPTEVSKPAVSTAGDGASSSTLLAASPSSADTGATGLNPFTSTNQSPVGVGGANSSTATTAVRSAAATRPGGKASASLLEVALAEVSARVPQRVVDRLTFDGLLDDLALARLA